MNIKTFDVIIIGGGLGGASLAYTLNSRNFTTVVIEKELNAAMGASGHIRGIALPVLHKELTPKMELVNTGLTVLELHLKELINYNKNFFAKKLSTFVLAHRLNELERFSKAKVLFQNKLYDFELFEKKFSEKFCGLPVKYGGVYFPKIWHVSIKELTKTYLELSNTKIIYFTHTQKLYLNCKKNIWEAFDLNKNFIARAKHLIICNSYGLNELEFFEDKQISNIGISLKNKLQKIRGQSFIISKNDLIEKLSCTLSYNGSVIPNINNQKDCLIGATFERVPVVNLEIDSKQNINIYKNFLDKLEILESKQKQYEKDFVKNISNLKTRVAIRTTTTDRLPLIGRLNKNLWLHTAFSSNGLSFAPLGAELIANEIESIEGKKSLVNKNYNDEIISQLYLDNEKLLNYTNPLR